MAEDEPLVWIGVVAGVRGIKGEVRIKARTERPADLTSYGGLRFADGSPVLIERSAPAKDGMIAKLKGIETRSQAEGLKGTRIYIARSALPEPDEDEFYYGQLIGLGVRSAAGEDIGEVRSVQDYGAGDLLEIKLHRQAQTVLVPFTKACVPVVNMAQGWLAIDPPAGLIEKDAGARAAGKGTATQDDR